MESLFDLGILPLQKTIVYGPVLSRRLGYSLGINLLSPHIKICSFDCVYCQYGKTHLKTRKIEKTALYSPDEILREVEKALLIVRKVDYLTLSGNGEPTLHPQFLEIVEGIKSLRNRYRPDVKIALFSNSTCLGRKEVQQAMELIDQPILKLDAGNERLFQKVNHPCKGIDLIQIFQD